MEIVNSVNIMKILKYNKNKTLDVLLDGIWFSCRNYASLSILGSGANNVYYI